MQVAKGETKSWTPDQPKEVQKQNKNHISALRISIQKCPVKNIEIATWFIEGFSPTSGIFYYMYGTLQYRTGWNVHYHHAAKTTMVVRCHGCSLCFRGINGILLRAFDFDTRSVYRTRKIPLLQKTKRNIRIPPNFHLPEGRRRKMAKVLGDFRCNIQTTESPSSSSMSTTLRAITLNWFL